MSAVENGSRRSGLRERQPVRSEQAARPPGRGCSIFCDSEWHSVSDDLNLSPREAQIIRGVFDDLSESGIALELGISTHTVHTYVERLYRKVGVSSRPGLLIRVFDTYLRRLRAARADGGPDVSAVQATIAQATHG